MNWQVRKPRCTFSFLCSLDGYKMALGADINGADFHFELARHQSSTKLIE